MNTTITSKDAILKVCREFVRENGLQALNMRSIAQKCNISVGSIYNYFPSKNDLMTAVVENIWQNIFHSVCIQTECFTEYVHLLFQHVRNETQNYPDFFASHAMNFAKSSRPEATDRMKQYFEHMESNLLFILSRDSAISPDLFTDSFTAEGLAAFTLTNLVTLWNVQKENCTFLLEMLRRILYR